MQIQYKYLELHQKSINKKGLSEKYVRKFLERDGFIVWRSGYIHLDFAEHYPNVRKKYERLYELLEKYHPEIFEELKYISHVHHGMPDFITFKDGKFKFIECKFEHEQLMNGQRKCINKLLKMGFSVEVYKLVSPKTRVRIVHENILTKEKTIKEKQTKLRKRY